MRRIYPALVERIFWVVATTLRSRFWRILVLKKVEGEGGVRCFRRISGLSKTSHSGHRAHERREGQLGSERDINRPREGPKRRGQ
jgi:hypothetical protein